MLIEDALKGLSWSKTETIQKKSMEYLSNIDDDDLIRLVKPFGKDCWQNAARVIALIGYPRIKHIINDLIKWLQDMNWPGAKEVFECLCLIPKELLIPYIKKAISEAENNNDEMWLYWIKELTTKCNIKT